MCAFSPGDLWPVPSTLKVSASLSLAQKKVGGILVGVPGRDPIVAQRILTKDLQYLDLQRGAK